MLEDNGLLYTVFDGITGEPDDTMIAAGAKKYKDEDSDFLIEDRRRQSDRLYESYCCKMFQVKRKYAIITVR